MYCVAAVAASPGTPVFSTFCLSATLSKVWTNNRPSSPPQPTTLGPLSGDGAGLPQPLAVAQTLRPSQADTLQRYTHSQLCQKHATDTTCTHLHSLYVMQRFPNSQWSFLNIYQDIKKLLIMSGIEQNPGPSPTQQLRVAHVNINSITVENRIDELLQFVQTNNIKICATTETKLDNTVSPTLYQLEGCHAPFT